MGLSQPAFFHWMTVAQSTLGRQTFSWRDSRTCLVYAPPPSM